MYFWLLLNALAGTCILAAWIGGRPEKLAAILFVVVWIASMATEFAFPLGSPTPPAARSVVDLGALLAMAAIAWTSGRYWPLALLSIQTILLIIHLAKWIDPHFLQDGYEPAAGMLRLTQVLILITGIMRHAWTERTVWYRS